MGVPRTHAWVFDVIQSAMRSARVVVSSRECGQSGPVISIETRATLPSARSTKYGAPES